MSLSSAPPNYYDAGSVGWKLTIFTGFFVPLQIAIVGLRLYVCRFQPKSSYGWDVYISICALACQMVLAALAIGSVEQAGVGIHQGWLERNVPVTIIVWNKYLVAIATWYLLTVNIPKLAILALYYQLFPLRKARIIIWIVVVVLCCASVSATIASLAACQPFEGNFDWYLPGRRCIDKTAPYIWSSIPNIITDIVMLVIPIPIVLKLRLSSQLKAGLVATFAVGSLGLITSVLRFRTFFTTNSFTDGTYAAVELITWTQTEPGIYLISACLPTYKVLIDRWGRRNRKRPSSYFSKVGNGITSACRDQNITINSPEGDDSHVELQPISDDLDTNIKTPANRIQVSTRISSESSSVSTRQNDRTIVS